jgi:hypothetical protein
VDPATGDLYVADTYNQTIRRITTSGPAAGTVVTLVGVHTMGNIAPGILPALLGFPSVVAVDTSTGNLLISVNDAILTSPY